MQYLLIRCINHLKQICHSHSQVPSISAPIHATSVGITMPHYSPELACVPKSGCWCRKWRHHVTRNGWLSPARTSFALWHLLETSWKVELFCHMDVNVWNMIPFTIGFVLSLCLAGYYSYFRIRSGLLDIKNEYLPWAKLHQYTFGRILFLEFHFKSFFIVCFNKSQLYTRLVNECASSFLYTDMRSYMVPDGVSCKCGKIG